ncbi:hypothetical protein RHGRI_000275 [Rhododendron griersonianum]|uniref:Uncharacterized protein n=1 Tax=Rhododendron griersonianum TaxID=479676 RepID=A0AAV6LH12_9ERIC|nr:hypothetical protein RHGRI_000275 [Rhododendron griersonianum]KAG5564046.1 hypothetical protein RHGRI_000275 [Rhododendron griersonianum]
MEALIRKSDAWISNTRREDDHQDREKYLAYLEQSRKTEGYEVTISRGRGVCGGVLPMDMSKERRYQDYDMCAQLAINKYNSIFKEQLGLEFVKVLFVTGRISCFMTFYITFEAKDLADGGMVKTYQTEVLMGLREGVWNVRAMRLKPGLDEQALYTYLILTFFLFVFHFNKVAILKEDGSGKTRNVSTGFQKKGEAEEAVLQKVVITDMRKSDVGISNTRREYNHQDREKYLAYLEQSRKTEGYEVTISPRGGVYCGVLPMDITKERRYKDYDMCAQLAIDKYNSIFKEQLGLEFVKVLFVTGRISYFMTFYITFEAKDLADGGMVKTYQTEVLLALREGVWNVRAMRLKPGLDEQGDLLVFATMLDTVAILKEDGSGKTRNLSTGFQEKGEGEEAVLQKVVITDMRSYTASWNISCKFSFRS